MKTDNQRRSENFEDRGSGGVGRSRAGASAAPRLLIWVVRRFGIKGVLVAGLGIAGVYFLAPQSIRDSLFAGVFNSQATQSVSSGQKVCTSSSENASACDFSRVVLASTEDVWASQFAQRRLLSYSRQPPATYSEPTLVVFSGGVSTGGCGNASSGGGPFYCPADRKLYIDPAFYRVMEQRLRAPGDFAQAYVLAHEVGHHVQNLIGAMEVSVRGETKKQVSVRVELQADCLAGVWGNSARATLQVSDEDLSEATQAAHAVGDDALGHSDSASFTHGLSQQRIRWFRRGFETGDARQCDTFAMRFSEL